MEVLVIRKRFKQSFFVVLFCYFILFPFSACYSSPAEESASERERDKASPAQIGILWEVSKIDVAPSYIFGTVHSEDERVTRLPEPVVKAFDEAKTFILEMLLDKVSTQEIMKKLYFKDGKKLKQVVGEELYSRSAKAMKEKSYPPSVIESMKPWAIFTILNMPEQKTGLFMDAMLFEQAKQQGKIIRGLETQQEQTAIFDEMPMSSQIALLRSTLDNLTDMNEMLDEVIDIYLSRDLNQILALNEKYSALIDKEIAKDFNQRLVIERNHRMVKRMLPLLDDGYCFVAVGALHLPGNEGILNLLKMKGYQVRASY